MFVMFVAVSVSVTIAMTVLILVLMFMAVLVMVPMFMDAAWINLDPMPTDNPARNLYDPLNGTSPTAGSAVNEGMPRCCVARHGDRQAGSAPTSVGIGVPLPGMINMGFCDGHVEEVKLQNLWQYGWHQGWVTPATRPP